MVRSLALGRMATFSVSGLLHLGLIAVALLAEQWLMSGSVAKLPALVVDLDTAAKPPDPPPPPPELPKPVPPRAPRPPKPIETPPPRVTESRPEPPADPPPPAQPVTETKPTPAAPAVNAAPAATPSAEPATASYPASGPTAPGAPAAPAAASEGIPASDGIPIGRAATAPPGLPVVAAGSRGGGATGEITQFARPQGGYQVRPSYPSTARRLGIQGTTVLKVHVLIDGRVGDVVVQETAGHPDLDQAASDAVRRWRFEPARRGSDPVAMWVLLPVEFQLK